jgi:hypothetical protein
MNQDLDAIAGEPSEDAFIGTLTLDRAPPIVDSSTIATGFILVHFLRGPGSFPHKPGL